MLGMTLDLHYLRLPRMIDHKRSQLASTDTPAVQTKSEFLQIESFLPVVSVHNTQALVLLLFPLLVVPELLPWSARVLGTGYACFQVDGAHVHDMERILILEWDVWNKPGVNDCEFAKVGDIANT